MDGEEDEGGRAEGEGELGYQPGEEVVVAFAGEGLVVGGHEKRAEEAARVWWVGVLAGVTGVCGCERGGGTFCYVLDEAG